MDNASVFISSFLEHAGSQYYDPVKAHEYYLRTRELQGRRSTSALRGKRKKEGWAYVKARVAGEKKAVLEKASVSNKENVAQLRSNGKAIRESISEKIKGILEQISGDTKQQIDALPKGLSKEERSQRVAEIREKAAGNKDKTRADRDAEKQELADNLKSALESAKESYDQTRESIKAKYEATLDREYEAIRTGSI